ncbi:helix-turn-helix domain-containing protein [Nocardia tengchongensis]
MDPIDLVAAEAVRAAVRNSGVTQKAVAESVGISRATWRRRMQGKSSFRIHELGRIAALLRVELATLVDAAMDPES